MNQLILFTQCTQDKKKFLLTHLWAVCFNKNLCFILWALKMKGGQIKGERIKG